ncbi:MAG: hypothetical protein EOM84_02655 [Sphingobacteriia bacterium]|nr:hypothetical protein [Sphingobacteriia bacterium]
MKNLISTMVLSFRAFFDIEGKVMSREGAGKLSLTVAGRFFYGVVDYSIAAGLGAVVFWMNAKNFSSKDIYLATFLYDFIAAAGFYWLSDKTGYDITLGKSFRRVVDVMHKRGFYGKLSGWLIALGVSLKAIIWEGPEVICFLFQKELKSRQKIWLSLFVLSALQGIFGAWLYTKGYDMWERYGSTYFKTESDLWVPILGVCFFVIIFIFVGMMKEVIRLITWLWRRLG